MRVGWLADTADVNGGAELTQEAFAAAAPDHVTIVDADPDVWVVHNCTQYDRTVIPTLESAPVVKYQHDQWPHGDPELRDWICENATLIYCSPLHRDRFPWAEWGEVCPPAIDLQAFRDAARSGLNRQGTIWLGHGLNPGKGIDRAVNWAQDNREVVHFFGEGPYMPSDTEFVRAMGPCRPDQAPTLLASYTRLLFLPTALEPFGRVLAEAAAAGCDLVTNRNVGARHYLENDPAALDTATDTFWDLVGRAVEGTA